MKRKRHNTLNKSTVLAISYTIASSSVLAETTEDKNKAPAQPAILSELVVTAQAPSPIVYQARSSAAALFTDTPLLETPFSVGVYGEQLIEDQRAFQLSDLLENDPSIAKQGNADYGFYNLSLRGFRVDNFDGYRVDGLPVINTTTPYLEDKERVELLKGPAALRFGLMPPGGAINLVRKRPTLDFSTSLQFDVNTFGNVYSQADVSDTQQLGSGTFGYRAVIAGEDFDSFYDNAGGDRFLGSLLLEWKPFENLNLWASAAGQTFTRNGYLGPLVTRTSRGVLDTGIDTNNMQDWARIHQDVLDFAFGADIKFNDDWKLRTTFGMQDSERTAALSYPWNVLPNGDFWDYALMTGDGLTTWKSFSNHTHVEGMFKTGRIEHEVVVGGQYRTYDHQRARSFPDLGDNNVYNPVNYPIPAHPTGLFGVGDCEETGVFLTDTIKFNDYFSALLGVRYSSLESRDALDPAYSYEANGWSPSAALMYRPVKNVHTYVTYTEGMQDGGTIDIGSQAIARGVQHTEQWEVGAKTELFDGRLWGELSLFQIDQEFAPNAASLAMDGLQRHRGVEATLKGKITDQLQAGISAMLLDAGL